MTLHTQSLASLASLTSLTSLEAVRAFLDGNASVTFTAPVAGELVFFQTPRTTLP